MKWAVPKMWEGQTVAVMASGPSMSEAVAARIRERGIPAITTNTTHFLAPWAAMAYAADAAWWTQYRSKVNGYDGLKVTVRVEPYPDLLALEVSGCDGFDPSPDKIRTGANSGYQAVHIAMQAGAKRVELHGLDMKATPNGVHHWHGTHPTTLRNHGGSIYERWIKSFGTLGKEAEKRGVQIVNCTPGSALNCFPFEAAP